MPHTSSTEKAVKLPDSSSKNAAYAQTSSFLQSILSLKHPFLKVIQ